MVWNFLGRSKHHSAQKHNIELIKRGIKEFEIPLSSIPRMMLSAQEMTEYVKKRRERKMPLTNLQKSPRNIEQSYHILMNVD